MAWNLPPQQQTPSPQQIQALGTKPHVKICIPHMGSVQMEWARCMLEPLDMIPQPDFDKQVLIARGILNLDSIPAYMPVLVRNKRSGLFDVSSIEDVAIFTGKDMVDGVERVRPDDLQVMSRQDGSWTDIKYVLRHSFSGTLKRINCVGGTLDVTANHSVYLSTPRHREMRGDGSVDAGMIEIGNRMAMLEPNVPKSDYKRFFLGGEDLAWFYGLFAAEGNVSNYRNIGGGISVSNNNKELLEKAKVIADHYFNDEFKIIKGGETKGIVTYALVASNIRLARQLKLMFYTSSGKKKVPTEVLNAPKNIMNAFFDGYMLGDGYVDGNGTKSFVTNSATLAMGLIFIVKQVGIGNGEVNIHRRLDKQDIVQTSINKGVEKDVKCSRGNLKDKKLVKSVYDINYDGFLYDLETESHKFTAGVGLFELHNTERNELIKMALSDPRTTHLLWLDTDVVCESPKDPNEAIRTLLNLNANLASGLYRAKQREGFNYAAWMRNPTGGIGYIPIGGWSQGANWIKVDVIGFGFCLTRRECFERVSYPWFEWGNATPSEDFVFCEKLNKIGIEVKVFTDCRLSHIGTLKVHTRGEVTVLDA